MFFSISSAVEDSMSRNLIFEILKQSKIAEILDVSDPFWSQFEISNENMRKQMGFYEIGKINNASICTIAVNPKEHFEKFKNRTLNKKHKGVGRETKEMNLKVTLKE